MAATATTAGATTREPSIRDLIRDLAATEDALRAVRRRRSGAQSAGPEPDGSERHRIREQQRRIRQALAERTARLRPTAG